MSAFATLIGRILLAAIFVISGAGKAMDYAGTQSGFTSMGLPLPALVTPAVIALELLGGILIVVGLGTRIVAVALAAFCIATALVAHTDFGNQVQYIMFLKNVAMCGGFLVLAAHGAGPFSIDWRRHRRRW